MLTAHQAAQISQVAPSIFFTAVSVLVTTRPRKCLAQNTRHMECETEHQNSAKLLHILLSALSWIMTEILAHMWRITRVEFNTAQTITWRPAKMSSHSTLAYTWRSLWRINVMRRYSSRWMGVVKLVSQEWFCTVHMCTVGCSMIMRPVKLSLSDLVTFISSNLHTHNLYSVAKTDVKIQTAATDVSCHN